MESSTIEEHPGSTPLRNKHQACHRERGERKKKGGNNHSSDNFDQNGPKSGSVSNRTVETLLHLTPALIKHDQRQVSGINYYL